MDLQKFDKLVEEGQVYPKFVAQISLFWSW